MKKNKSYLSFLHLSGTGSVRLLWLLFCLLAAGANAQTITGTVFRDFNADGIYTPITNPNSYTYGEPGVSRVVVTAYSANTATAPISATTNAGGAYTLTVGSAGAYRVEFTNLPSGLYDSPAGANSRSSVRFVNGGSSGVDLGVSLPEEYCQTNPKLLMACYENGSGEGNTNPVLVSINYRDTGTNKNAYPTNATADAVGSVWGLAYDPAHKLSYASTFLKRNTGVGNRGLDGIYVIDHSLATPALAGGLDLTGVVPSNGGSALAFGSVTRTLVTGRDGSGANELAADRTLASRDADAFGKVGKAGYGGISIDHASHTLWAVNLFERSLIAVDISAPLQATAVPNTIAASKVKRYFIDGTTSPSILGLPACPSGTMRPFGIKLHNGIGYLGVVCDGASLSSVDMTANQKAYVLSFNPANPTAFTEVTSVPLNYARERGWVPFSPTTTFDALESDNWQRWIDTYTDPTTFGDGVNSTNQDIKTGINGTFVGAPQPILADIDFLPDGSLVLGFMDRFAHQQGWRNYIPGGTTLRSAVSQGDILLAYATGTGYTFEGPNENDNFTTPPVAANQQAGQLLNDGPSGAGEYFYQDYYIGSDATHPETALGGLAVLPGANEVASVAFDPAAFNAMGVRWLNTTTGYQTRVYTVVENTSIAQFGKGSGLGDAALLCNQAPVEIGNRVWVDSNDNGVQDAGEPALAGVTVTLQGPGLPGGGVSVTTNTNGEYYFSSGQGTAAVGYAYSLTGLTQGGAYTLSFPTSFSANAYSISRKPNAASGAQADAIDTDAASNGQISFTLGGAGENNFSFDVGFVPQASLGDYTFIDANHNGIQDVNDTPLAGVTVVLYTNGAAVATTTTDASGLYSFTGLAASSSYSYSVGFTTPAGYVITGQHVGDSALDSDADPVTGRTQSVTLAAGQNDTSLDAGFYIPYASLGDYVFEDVNRDGIQNSGDLPIASATVTLLQSGTVVQTTRTDANGLYRFTGLTPGLPYSVSFTAPAGFEGATSALAGGDRALDSDPVNGLTAPVTLTANENNLTIDAGFVRPLPVPVLTLAKTVSNKRPELGSVVTYTLTVSNPGPGLAAAGTVLRDSLINGVTLVPGSVATSFGSTTVGAPGLLWDLSSLPASATVTMTYQASLTAEGVLFNYAAIPGSATASVCLTVPIHVCAGAPFEFELSAPTSFSAYQWSRNGQPIPGATSATLSVTMAGEYSIAAVNSGGCADGSCCPFVIVEDPLPSLSAVAQSARCVGTTPQNDAAITLVSSNSAAVRYNVTLGSSFTAAAPLFSSPQPLSAVVGGILVANQPNPATPTDYTVRVYSGNGCFTDTVVTLQPTVCACPPLRCAPLVVRKTKAGGKPVQP